VKTFEKTSFLHCEIEKLFSFHLDMKNLRKITPSNTQVEFLNKDFVPYIGGIVKIKTVKHFIPTTWEIKIKKLESPNLLVDVALKSPFKYWEHSHIFIQKANGCEIKDIIRYKLPFGKIGELFDFFIQKELQSMFDFRHKVTKNILEDVKI
jgi:hypothetical protein